MFATNPPRLAMEDRLSNLSQSRLSRKAGRYDTALQLIVFTGLYSFYFTRQYLRGDIVMGGDTQLLWSLNYLALYSIREYGEFLWWDPTALNGWPAYVNLTAGWFNYL